ncbi:MAG: glycerophosphodiester phosphodiesterase, partial [Acidimicrobiia bacterium]
RVSDLVVGALRARGGVDRVLVSSFRLEAIDRVRAGAPELGTGYLAVAGDPLLALDWTVERGHRALHPAVAMLAGDVLGELVARAHDRGIDVNVWTVNDSAELVRLRAAGVDGVITDDPALARSVYGEPPG